MLVMTGRSSAICRIRRVKRSTLSRLKGVADRGYYKGLETLACEQVGTDLRQQSRRPIWQAGFHLHCGIGRVSIPCGAVINPTEFADGGVHVIALLILLGLPVLRNDG